METPEKIKKGLRIHSMMHNGCVGCPYKKLGNRCQDVMFKELRAYIQQLEADNARLRSERDAACLKNRSIETMHPYCGEEVQYGR